MKKKSAGRLARTGLGKLRRRVHREAKRLLERRRYREQHGTQLASVWSIRKGPSQPRENVSDARKRKKAGNLI